MVGERQIGETTLSEALLCVKQICSHTKGKMSDQPKPDLGLLEEDDEFEEFPAEGKWIVYVPEASDIVFFLFLSLCDQPSLAKLTTVIFNV